jgi:hypothetical protein
LLEKIKELNGKISDTDFTHLILPKLSKSSKYFMALARGAFILHAQYVHDSCERGLFLKPQTYEYGNPEFKLKAVTNVKEKEMFDGPYKCRMMIQSDREKYTNGIFTNMTFILKTAKEKFESFRQVIEAGGGSVLKDPQFQVSILKREKVNYCLFDAVKALSESEKKVLNACSIEMKPVKFIYDLCLGGT